MVHPREGVTPNWTNVYDGGHSVLYCMDCLNLMRLWPDAYVDLVVTDPPYNVGKDYGHATNDNMPEAEYLEWYAERAAEVFRVHKGGYLYVSCSTAQLWTLRPVWEQVGYSFQMLLIWHGPNLCAPGGNIHRQWMLLYEPILMFLKGPRLPMLNEIQGIKTDAVITTARPQRNFNGDQRREHVAQKPIALYRTLIARTPGQVIFDPFMGSGASGCAAKQLGRDFRGCDISRDYFDIAVRRITEAQAPLPGIETATQMEAAK
jgi:site-specific DNA-methyltransferase (adenine-specific)